MEHYCGVFGCITADPWPTDLDVAQIICRALIGLQHRGQESAGIVTSYGGIDAKDLFTRKGHGLVSQIFKDDVLANLKGNMGVGHTRYSTHGGSSDSNTTGVQPFVVDTIYGLLAVAHNGELTNARNLRKDVLKRGVGLSSFSDSELITQMLSLSPPEDPDDWPGRIKQFMESSPLSYSLVIMHADKIYAVRDPYGNRPLCIGRLNRLVNCVADNTQDAIGWVVSSETCPFYSIGAELIREVLPGEIVEIGSGGFKSLGVVPRPGNAPPAFCIFEYVYFARPDSYLEGQMVYTVRKNCGKMLSIESYVEADIVSTIPESATPAAVGYAEHTGIPYVEVLCKNRYVGRSFIQPTTRLRQLAVARKFGPYVDNIRGKRIILVDDSIVRGTTMQPMVALLRSCGALEVHVRIASPPIKHPCYMGINIPTKEELIANRVELDKLAEHFGANSVYYLSVEGLKKAVAEGAKADHEIGQCTACLTGKYPVALEW